METIELIAKDQGQMGVDSAQLFRADPYKRRKLKHETSRCLPSTASFMTKKLVCWANGGYLARALNSVGVCEKL